jgi:uncharacterized lipoprotein YehR (DUF1307 family)
MKNLFLVSLLFLLSISCSKIPSREATTIQVLSVNGIPYLEGTDIEINYGDDADIVFEYISEDELEYAYIKIVKGTNNEVINNSDDQYITNHPQAGDLRGTFTYTVKTLEQFDEPIGNPVVDIEQLRVIIMNKAGTVEVFNVTILPL